MVSLVVVGGAIGEGNRYRSRDGLLRGGEKMLFPSVLTGVVDWVTLRMQGPSPFGGWFSCGIIGSEIVPSTVLVVLSGRLLGWVGGETSTDCNKVSTSFSSQT